MPCLCEGNPRACFIEIRPLKIVETNNCLKKIKFVTEKDGVMTPLFCPEAFTHILCFRSVF